MPFSPNRLPVATLTCLALLATVSAAKGQEAGPESAKTKRLPREFMILFSFGYGADDLFPQDRQTYEKVLLMVKEADFTAVTGTYADWKLDLCRKHGLKLVVNLLSDAHHVYKNPDGAKALCERLRGNETVWGYHLFSDMNYKLVSGRNRDIDNVHQWDPTHPTFVGSYKLSGNGRLTNPDVHAYYDFHWQRGPHLNFPHLVSAWQIAREKDCYFYRWVWVSSGRPGHPDRARYTVNTSLACGLKGVFWFLGQQMMDRDTWQWNQYGKDIAAINAEVLPLGPELMELGNPVAVYSTGTSLGSKGRPKEEGAPPVPPPLVEIPGDHWFQVTGGEAVLGMYKDPQGLDVVLLANHNAHGPQEMTLRFTPPVRSLRIFRRQTRTWEEMKLDHGTVSFHLANASSELLKIGPKSSTWSNP